ncbi:G-type lectin S-receptor-like serine/threonine-protein kinase LECRK3 [Nymphaea colorata]|uniref:Receptor-like serine/threonine-protein kinase n=1 Tax=Nymphaea colorata TaxID=210225 RepID=A0A5K1GF02_9MAGN|nr:G-type lectin S-receptor-like serine/threonine-protein kinase LECRK3 [Nymphaea colorata]
MAFLTSVFLLCCFSLLHVIVEGQAYQNISLGSSLSSLYNTNAWVSPSGEFSFGFSMVNGSLYVGIRYEKIPEKPLVWTANRDKPAPPGSTVVLNNNGVLVINDAKGVPFSTIGASSDGSVITSAAMLDTGNLVLQTSPEFAVKWQSFDSPTDTILPTQKLAVEKNLYASFSPTNLSTGRYYIVMQNDGNFVSYTDMREPTYASSITWGQKGNLVFDESGKISVFQWELNKTVEIIPGSVIPKPSTDFYFRAKIDYDGIFRLYSYPKRPSNSWPDKWNIVWATLDYACEVPAICGLNAYCVAQDEGFDCLCPKGFSYVDAANKLLGCKQDIPITDCKSYNPEHYSLETIDNMNFFGPHYAIKPSNEFECREWLLADCYSIVGTYWDSKCYKKRMPLRSGNMTSRCKVIVKVPRDNGSLLQPSLFEVGGPSITSNGMRKWSQSGVVRVVLFVISVSLFLLLIIETVVLICLKRWSLQRQEKPVCSVQPEMKLMRFSYKELEKATRGFKEKLGSGSFGSVYRGMMASAYGQKPIAVKRFDKLVEDGDKEFETEVSVIGRTHHKNLVQLIGFCDEGSHRLLVYEYMEQGSLSSVLLGSIRPEWNLRVQIAVGIARGLMYLHEECITPIIHCDIKPENVLVDCYLVPKISDFGLAKLLRHDQTKTKTDIRGTRGYVAPEWFRKMAITVKVDVYSYGLMLLEIICCRKNVELNRKDEPSVVLADWAYDCFVAHQLEMLVEHDEDAKNDMRKVKKMVMVALWCIQEDPSLRPTMKKVTQMLEGAVGVAIPPNPSSLISSTG